MKDICKACGRLLHEENAIGNKNGYNLLRCNYCETVTVSPFPSEQQLIEFYQNYKGTAGYNKKRDKKIKRSIKRVRKIINFTRGKRFLDVGCNAGYVVYAAQLLGFDAFGIELDCETVSEAQKEFGEELFKCTTIQEYAKTNRQFDVIYTSEVIEHVPDPDAFLKSASGLLDKGGVLYLTTPDGNHFTLPKNFSSWNAVTPPEHIIYFTKKGLNILLAKHGFKIEKTFFNIKPGIKLIARKV